MRLAAAGSRRGLLHDLAPGGAANSAVRAQVWQPVRGFISRTASSTRHLWRFNRVSPWPVTCPLGKHWLTTSSPSPSMPSWSSKCESWTTTRRAEPVLGIGDAAAACCRHERNAVEAERNGLASMLPAVRDLNAPRRATEWRAAVGAILAQGCKTDSRAPTKRSRRPTRWSQPACETIRRLKFRCLIVARRPRPSRPCRPRRLCSWSYCKRSKMIVTPSFNGCSFRILRAVSGACKPCNRLRTTKRSGKIRIRH